MLDKKTVQGRQTDTLKRNYDEGRQRMGSSFDFYNLIEKCLLEVPLSGSEKQYEKELDV
jgi:hypothetical protein